MLSNGKNSKPEWFSKVQQMRNEEVDFLYEMVEQTEGDILEIGMGGSTFAFLDATKDTDSQVWSIDMKNKLEKYGVTKVEVVRKDETDFVKREDYHVPFKVRLVNAYPYSFSTVAYSAGPAQAVKCTVAFYYEYQNFMFN